MGVYLGCFDALVTEHILYLSDACTARQQMCSERVAEDMRANRLFDTRALNSVADNIEYHNAGQSLASIAQKEYVLVFRVFTLTLVHIYHYALTSDIADWYKALLATLAHNADITLTEE